MNLFRIRALMAALGAVTGPGDLPPPPVAGAFSHPLAAWGQHAAASLLDLGARGVRICARPFSRGRGCVLIGG